MGMKVNGGEKKRGSEERSDWLEEESEQKKEGGRLEKMEGSRKSIGKEKEEVDRKEMGRGGIRKEGIRRRSQVGRVWRREWGMKDKKGRWKKKEEERGVVRKRKE